MRSTAVGSGPEKDGFTFDRVFPMGTKQHEVFDYGVKEWVSFPRFRYFELISDISIVKGNVWFTWTRPVAAITLNIFLYRCSRRLQWYCLRIWPDRKWKDVHYDGIVPTVPLSISQWREQFSGSGYRLWWTKRYHTPDNRADLPINRWKRRAFGIPCEGLIYGNLSGKNQRFARAYALGSCMHASKLKIFFSSSKWQSSSPRGEI